MRRPILISVVCGVLVAGADAAQSPPENVVLLKNVDRGESYSGNWGYTAPDGTELAISGTFTGTTFIDATDPANAVEVAFIPGPNNGWREMATYGEYAYIVTEGNGAALQVVSLLNPVLPTLVATLNPPAVPFSSAHEIKIDQQTGYLYAVGTGDGMFILDLTADPVNPPVRGTWTETYVHDLSLLDGRAYCAAIFGPNWDVYVLDVSQPGTPPTLGRWSYPGAATHNTWPTADGSYLVTTDETTGGHLRMWDIRDLGQVQQTGEYTPITGSIVHNAYIRGQYCFMSHYLDGLRVVDISDPSNLVSVGWYDTHVLFGPGFDGAWGCYALAADPTIAYISDTETGTYILQFQPPTAALDEPETAGVPSPLLLRGAFPNPFHPATAIRFELGETASVRARIFDAAGRPVRGLADAGFAPGMHSLAWDGRDDGGRALASGVYFYRLEAAGLAETGRLVLAR